MKHSRSGISSFWTILIQILHYIKSKNVPEAESSSFKKIRNEIEPHMSLMDHHFLKGYWKWFARVIDFSALQFFSIFTHFTFQVNLPFLFFYSYTYYTYSKQKEHQSLTWHLVDFLKKCDLHNVSLW